MHENGEPASLGTIEEVRAGELSPKCIGRRVSFVYGDKRIHGELARVDLIDGEIDLFVGERTFRVDADTAVAVIIQTAAEATAERKAGAAGGTA